MEANAKRTPFGDRGLAVYGGVVEDTYGRAQIWVQDSSAAMLDAAWLHVKGEAHLDSPPSPHPGIPFGVAQGGVAAHLDITIAKAIRDNLNAWIKFVEGIDGN